MALTIDATSRAGRKALTAMAAAKYGLDPRVLWGVFGTESGFGTNLGPSSAGARGNFQFMPATARSLGVRIGDFTSEVNGAAKYLKQLGADSKLNSPATIAALNKYSGGGGSTYVNTVVHNSQDWLKGGAPHVQNIDPSKPPRLPFGLGTPPSPGDIANSATGGATGAISDIGNFVKKLGVIFELDWWKRVGMILLGVVALVLALQQAMKQFGISLPKVPIPIPL